MRSTTQIAAEIAKLRKLLLLKDRWNAETRRTLEATVEALSGRLTRAQVETRWWQDETSEEYRDGDNNLCHEVCRAVEWMNGSKGYEAPSKNTGS